MVVMAKEPNPGSVKTRLCPPLEPDQAAAVHEAFVADTVARLVGRTAWRVALAVTPERGAPRLERLARRWGVSVVPQGGGDLGSRMARVSSEILANGARVAVLLGADTPDLPLVRIEQAVAAAAAGSIALGPARDGGYYLLALGVPAPELFDLDVAWGSRAVFAATLERARTAALPVTVLPPWQDVDEAAALAELSRRLDEGDTGLESTRNVLEKLGFLARQAGE
ncbi:MAG: glycosyltransferase [Candidatus Dadabacteria bacterium]|nr:MAG: glycosyltransferase [Candidatus Dadabacteria bacterium]